MPLKLIQRAERMTVGISAVELTVTGQVGLNLQATKKQTGAFVDSFYKGHDADGGEIILPAESTFGAQLIGAIISSVNGEDVTGFQAITVCQIISKAERPLILKFLVGHRSMEDPLEIENFAALPWLLEHLDELSTSSSGGDDINRESISLVKKRVLNYADCVRVLQNLELLKKHDSGNIVKFEETMASRAWTDDTDVANRDVEKSLTRILETQKDVISKELMPSFVKSIAMKRMGGYLFNFPSYPKLAFSDILRNKTLLFHFFTFLSRSNRRHILLLCYVNLMENKTDVLSNLVLCSTALDICKEAALLSLKSRADQIIKMLRTPIAASAPEIPNSQPRLMNKGSVCIPEYHKLATKLCSDVMDCLAWEYTLVLYPSFETSKDYTILHSYILNEDKESMENKNRLFRSREGSLNELIRTKKLPSSLTVHRRVKADIIANSVTTKGSTDYFSIIKFDTIVNGYDSQRMKTGKLVTTSIAVEECSSAQIQVSGDVSRIDLICESNPVANTGLDNNEDLNALVPFFLPTGKAVIPYIGSHRRLADNFQPPPKLYSMILKARDQTTIYACSLVLYRPVLLVEDLATTGTSADRRRVAGVSVSGLKLDGLIDAAIKEVASPLVESYKSESIDNCIASNNSSKIITLDGALTAQSKVSMTIREDQPSVILLPGLEHTVPFQAQQVCAEQSITNDSTTLSVPVLKKSEFKLPAVNLTSPSGPVDAIFVSELTATTPAVLSQLSCSPRDLVSPIGISSPVVVLTATDSKVKFSTDFSDDESAGLSSSITSLDQQTPRSHSAAHSQKKPAIGVLKYPQGVFTDFLSATANATASVASAIALQAGSLPSSSFAWSGNINASKSNEPKGFYDQLSFSRFKTMHFTTNSPVQFDNASKLKRKYEGHTALDPSPSDLDKSLSADFKSLHLPTSVPPFSPTVLNKNLSSQWNFSPEKALTSYPRFGAAKSTRKKTSSPRTPSWSPGQRNAGHNHYRKLRSHLNGNVRMPLPHSTNRDVSGSISTSETSSTSFGSEPNRTAQTAEIHVPDLGSSVAAKNESANVAPPLPLNVYGEDFVSEEEVKGVAYVAYGFALLTEVPTVGRLRQAASNAVPDFTNACNPQNTVNSTVPLDDIALTHLIAKCAKPSLKVDRDNSSSPNVASFCDSDPDLTTGSYYTSGERSGDYDSSVVFDALSPKNLVTVLIAFLLEYRIVAVSSRTLSASTHLGEWLKDAIHPLKYAHVYSPLVPPCIGLQLIHCPAPFFIGMKRTSKIDEVVESEDERDREKIKGRRGKSASSKDNSSCGLLLIDLDRDECSMPQDLCLLVKSARVLIRALEDLLYPRLSGCDEIVSIEKESNASAKGYQALQLCRQFVGSLLEGSRKSCLRAEDGDEHIVIFDEILFMQQHFTRLSLHPTVIAKSKHSEKQNITEAEHAIVDEISSDRTSLLPLTASGGKDIEKLLRSLIITQCFSLYLTS